MQIDKLRGKETDQLFKSILSLRDLDECYRFLMIYAQLMKFHHWHSVLK